MRLSRRADGAMVSPGILIDVSRMRGCGGKRCSARSRWLSPFDTIDDALELANDSAIRIAGRGIYARPRVATLRFSEDFEVGALWINEATRFRLDIYPFGGMKRSGVGREGVRYAIEEMSQLKFTGITI